MGCDFWYPRRPNALDDETFDLCVSDPGAVRQRCADVTPLAPAASAAAATAPGDADSTTPLPTVYSWHSDQPIGQLPAKLSMVTREATAWLKQLALHALFPGRDAATVSALSTEAAGGWTGVVWLVQSSTRRCSPHNTELIAWSGARDRRLWSRYVPGISNGPGACHVYTCATRVSARDTMPMVVGHAVAPRLRQGTSKFECWLLHWVTGELLHRMTVPSGFSVELWAGPWRFGVADRQAPYQQIRIAADKSRALSPDTTVATAGSVDEDPRTERPKRSLKQVRRSRLICADSGRLVLDCPHPRPMDIACLGTPAEASTQVLPSWSLGQDESSELLVVDLLGRASPPGHAPSLSSHALAKAPGTAAAAAL